MRRAVSLLLAVLAMLVPVASAIAAPMRDAARVELGAENRVKAILPSGVVEAEGHTLFLQRDPNGYQDSVNLYAYARNNPVNYRDPTGRVVPAALAVVAVPVMEYAAMIGAGVCFGLGLFDEANGVDICPGPADEAGRATRVLGRSGAKLSAEVVEEAATAAGALGPKLAEEARAAQSALLSGLKTQRERLVALLHKRELGIDPDIGGRFRKTEANLASDIEESVGRRLRRALEGDVGDWVDSAGKTYDAVGPVPGSHFNLSSFTESIRSHLLKQGLDRTVVDLRGLSAEQIASVEGFLAGLSTTERGRILIFR